MTGIKRSLMAAVLMVMCHTGNAEHTFDFSARFRIADLQENENSGKAMSALGRVSLSSQWSDSFSTFIEVDHVETGYQNQYSDGVRFNGQPLIPDVPGSDLNQLHAQLKLGAWAFTLGRQAIAFDNQRFVGSVSIWQNEQTFDAFLLERSLFRASTFEYAYIDNANRIFGNDAGPVLTESDINFVSNNGVRPLTNLGDHEQNTHLMRLELNEMDYSKFVFYSYFINNKDAVAASSDTLGAHYRFKIKPNKLQYRIELEAAAQERTEVANTPNLPYYRLDVGLALQSIEFSAQRESLGAKNGSAFFTPLATLHDFHGWADKFNFPPSNGLVDDLLKVKWRITPFKFDLRYHRFASEEGNVDFGDETDFDIIFKPAKKHLVLLRFSDFRAANESQGLSDERRVFLHYAYNMGD